MPELPDIAAYIEALEERVLAKPLEAVRVASPFVVRSYDPPLKAAEGRAVQGLGRLGKRIVFSLEGDLRLVLHLMVAGRLRYLPRGAKVPRKLGLCAFDFPDATLLLTEASKKKRASIHLVRGDEGLAELDPGGVEVLGCSLASFRRQLLLENHTVKRTLTDPRVFSGIGNAYSDEILHRARLSPVKWTSRLGDDEIAALHEATQDVLTEWIERLRLERAGEFPEKVTAFRPEMAVHGRYRQPCPVCATPVQRIVRGESEVNYCPGCQTGGKLLADRALSRLLRGDWPKTLEELEDRKARQAGRVSPAVASAQPAQAAPGRARRPRASAAKPGRQRPLLLFAHGAGASSSSDWMRGWARRLAAIGEVVTFDYPYMEARRKRPDPLPRLLEAHREALERARRGQQGAVVLIGKSMGGRIGCHLALEVPVTAVICLGYPLVSPGKSRAVRDQVLLETRAPILFVQGTRDRLCPLATLEQVRARMVAPHELHVVEAGDHSLLATKTRLRAEGATQGDVDARVAAAIADFIARQLG